jgi:AcrR family transcriptional regulator
LDKAPENGARERIISAAIELFSKNGYDATRVSEIANAANVNKALIYYYFQSKEDMLDYMVHSLFDNAVAITMDFIQANIVKMIQDGYLDIKPDRLHFVSNEAINRFMQNTYSYYEKVLDYVIENRDIIRILILESLKKGKHQNSLFRFMKLIDINDENPIYKTIYNADHDFVFSDEMVLFNFFFSFVPMVVFAAYFDDYKVMSSLSHDDLRSSFLRVYHVITSSLISGRDIMLRNVSA